MTTNYLFTLEGQVTSTSSSNIQVGDAFSMIVNWSSDILDGNPGSHGHFYGMNGEFSLGSINTSGIFECSVGFSLGDAGLTLSSIIGAMPETPDHQLFFSILGQGTALFDNPNDPGLFLPSIAAHFQSATFSQVDFYNVYSGVEATVGIDDIQLQMMQVPEPASGTLLGLAIVMLVVTKKLIGRR